ncbi:CRISPR-associated helicase/endonuclease Cas3 [Marinospirillum insulare]|uniref:CRISPR-associated helicase/endonuclease Cas3 n=1 Tax=Marinospirillum insulare TaxID=217169 RepID=A0ABQ5ZW47_9GAMM|nr:CRISPR-associated helicase/endonuclease Cas3 [Marinospirillum insulare]GLR62602.1 CRISPR-associated helicase/endonuclease Cas3 [Marinospirillum insulare]
MRRKKTITVKPKAHLVDFSVCPAKTFEAGHGFKLGRSVENHCHIVGEVAREIIHRLPTKHLFPPGSAFTAATHDIGKVSPTFYNKLMRACGLPLIPNVNPDLEKQWGGHAGVSQLTAKAMNAPEYIPEILGQHHGFTPPVSGKRANDDVFGSTAWQQEREKLVLALQEALGESWPEIKSYAQARLLAGLTSVADWIGSGEHFDDPTKDWQKNIRVALDQAGFVQPTYKKDLSFEQVFGFPPREAQSLLIEQAASPGVYVLEAPMGLGKTEAALYVAYQQLSTGNTSGVYFALPTQLTSNKIFERFQGFLDQILTEDCEQRSLLLHANAWLYDTDMGEEGRPGGAWFNQAKRGLLAPFAVGTIDQALMAAMHVKHGFVRAFGLAGKVVILDEVHTYDAYTGTLLDALVKLLRELDCTVIILSATLNQERRQQIIGSQTSSMAYPLITSFPQKANEVTEVVIPKGDSRQVHIHLQENDDLALEEALKRAEQGQQILWIENTVKEAQERYLDLAARANELGVACGLLHSRFTLHDRHKIEEKWVGLFGKPGWLQRQQQGRILVGTQVLEQSLDIDADFMVSRFAPTDMLLQRFGRLWRHEDTPRCSFAKPEAWLLAPKLKPAIEAPAAEFGSSAFVYSPFVLCRSLEVWQGKTQVTLPDDIRPLIEDTYKAREEQGAMLRWLMELKEGSRYKIGQQTLQQLANISLAQTGVTLPESKAQTRYSEADNFEVLILRSIKYDQESQAGVLVLITGEQIVLPLRRSQLGRADWRKCTAKLMQHLVNVRIADAPKQVPTQVLKHFGLQHCFYLGNPDWQDDESLLRVALLTETDELKGIEHMTIHDKYPLEYRDDLGYQVIKN